LAEELRDEVKSDLDFEERLKKKMREI